MADMWETLQLFELLQSAHMRVDQQRCVRVRNRNASCDACAQACASKCIAIANNELTVDLSACIGCGACATACPTGALVADAPDDAAVFYQAAAALAEAGGVVVFADEALCERAAGLFDPKKVVCVKTLGRVDESLLLGLVARGARSIVLAHAPEADTVPNTGTAHANSEGASMCAGAKRTPEGDTAGAESEVGSAARAVPSVGVTGATLGVSAASTGAVSTGAAHAGIAIAQSVADTANVLLRAWGSDARVIVTTKLPRAVRACGPVDHDASKRAFFSDMAHRSRATAQTIGAHALGSARSASAPQGVARSSATRSPAKVGDDGTLPHATPARRSRLLKALAHMGRCEDELIETRLWGNVMIDSNACTGCRMCAVFCPTGALRPADESGVCALVHTPARCVKCRLCEDVCQTGALSISNEVFARDLVAQASEVISLPCASPATSNPHSIERKMKELLGTDQVYER